MGMGYVGLTLAVVLAKRGFRVFGIEINADVVADLQAGKPHFQEKGLPQLLQHEQSTGRLSIHTALPDEEIDAYIISVGTPLVKGQQEPNIDYIQNVLRDVANHMQQDALVVLRSTVPVGLSRSIALPVLEEHSKLKAGEGFSFVFAPERTIEGKAIIELESNSQIIGGYDEKSVTVATDLFRKITPTILVVSSIEAAEMVKLIDNSYRDIRFAYANEIAMVCEQLNLDATELVNAANTHYPRNNVPVPSPGVGGACLSKDPHILYDFSSKAGYKPELIKHGRVVNEYIPIQMVARIKKHLAAVGKDIASAKVFLVGFAFKGQPETSDLRDSTSLWFLDALQKEVTTVYGYDPVVARNEIEKLGVTVTSIEEGCADADVVVFLNNHASYKDLDPFKLCRSMKKPSIFYDAWRMFEKSMFDEIDNVTYMGVGT